MAAGRELEALAVRVRLSGGDVQCVAFNGGQVLEVIGGDILRCELVAQFLRFADEGYSFIAGFEGADEDAVRDTAGCPKELRRLKRTCWKCVVVVPRGLKDVWLTSCFGCATRSSLLKVSLLYFSEYGCLLWRVRRIDSTIHNLCTKYSLHCSHRSRVSEETGLQRRCDPGYTTLQPRKRLRLTQCCCSIGRRMQRSFHKTQ